MQNLAKTSRSLMGIPDVSGSLTLNLAKNKKKKKRQKEEKILDTGQEFLNT